jgi:hypothetical protein
MMSPYAHPLLKKRAMDALLDTMAEADYESLGAHRRGEPYEPEQKGTEFASPQESHSRGDFDVTIPAKDIAPPSGPEDATFFKESDPEFEMSASGMRRVFAKGDSPEWQKIQTFLSGRDYQWLGRVSDGTEMWGKRNERVVYDPATMTWRHSVGGVVDLEGTEPELEEKMTAYGFDRPTPKGAAVKSCVACETDWCLEHQGIPEVEVKEHEFFKESEPMKQADSETRSYGFGQPLGGSDNPTGGSDDENADEDQNADLGGMDMTGSWKSPLLKKKALVDIHETPTMLPPRDDMKRHLDQDEQDEAMLGVVDPLAKPRRPAKPQQIDPNLHIGAAKLKWKVDSPPVGAYRSFSRRGWPTAEYADGKAAVQLQCEDEYVPRDVKEGKHAPIAVYVADWNIKPEERDKRGAFVWRKLKSTFPTLKEAQAAAAKVVDEHPELHGEPAAPPETPKQADYDEQADMEGEYFLDQVQDAKNEAKRHFMEEDYLQQIADEYIPPISMEQLWKIMGEEYTAEFYGSPYTRAHDFTDEEVPEGWEGTRKLNDSTGNAGRFASRKCPLCKSARVRTVDDDAKGYSSGMVLAECRDCRGFYTTSAH